MRQACHAILIKQWGFLLTAVSDGTVRAPVGRYFPEMKISSACLKGSSLALRRIVLKLAVKWEDLVSPHVLCHCSLYALSLLITLTSQCYIQTESKLQWGLLFLFPNVAVTHISGNHRWRFFFFSGHGEFKHSYCTPSWWAVFLQLFSLLWSSI